MGLHYHLRQADYWYALRGTARVVLHDLRQWARRRTGRPRSSTSTANGTRGSTSRRGVAHGFAALTDLLLCYLVDNYYDNSDELGLAWDDPAVGRRLGRRPIRSSPRRDQGNPRRADIPDDIRCGGVA